MEPLFEFVFEVVMQLVAEMLVSAGQHRKERGETRTTPPWLVAMGCIALGALAGWLSSLMFPKPFLTSSVARWANLALTPVAVGVAMAAIGRRRARKGQPVAWLEHFAFAYFFALAMSVVRLVACR